MSAVLLILQCESQVQVESESHTGGDSSFSDCRTKQNTRLNGEHVKRFHRVSYHFTGKHRTKIEIQAVLTRTKKKDTQQRHDTLYKYNMVLCAFKRWLHTHDGPAILVILSNPAQSRNDRRTPHQGHQTKADDNQKKGKRNEDIQRKNKVRY